MQAFAVQASQAFLNALGIQGLPLELVSITGDTRGRDSITARSLRETGIATPRPFGFLRVTLLDGVSLIHCPS